MTVTCASMPIAMRAALVPDDAAAEDRRPWPPARPARRPAGCRGRLAPSPGNARPPAPTCGRRPRSSAPAAAGRRARRSPSRRRCAWRRSRSSPWVWARVGGEMQIGEQHLAVAQHGDSAGCGSFTLTISLGRRRRPRRRSAAISAPARDIGGVVDADTRAGALSRPQPRGRDGRVRARCRAPGRPGIRASSLPSERRCAFCPFRRTVIVASHRVVRIKSYHLAGLP